MLAKEQVGWLMALSAPLVALNRNDGAEYDTRAFRPHSTPDASGLKDSWDIADRDDLLETVGNMTDRGHAERFAGEYWQWSSFTLAKRQRIREQHSANDRLIWDFIERSALMTGPGGTRSWDIGRMSFLLRSGYHLGWLDEKECDFLHGQLALRARYWYPSWSHYMQGFMSGLILWRAMGSDDPAETRRLLVDGPADTWVITAYRDLRQNPANPANLHPWHLPLTEQPRPASLPEALLQ